MNAQKKSRRTYGDDYKIQIVEGIESGKIRVTDVLNQGVYSSMLARWRKQYKAGQLKPSESASKQNGGALEPAETPPQSIEVLPARRKYVKRNQVPVVAGPESAIVHKEMAYWLDRSCRKLVEAIRAGQVGVEQLTTGYTVDMLNAARAARGGK